MDYSRMKCLVTGVNGFIGSELCVELESLGADVLRFEGDVRDMAAVSKSISPQLDYVFHFGSPSSNVLFGRNPAYCVDATVNGFLNVARCCQFNGVKLIYPSTGLIAQNSYNPYARCKKVLEDIHLGSGLNALGLRIYAGYGPGEEHKGDYASVIQIFTSSMRNGRSPVFFGDGSQTRDFIFISDLVKCILELAQSCQEKIVEVGSGNPVSFNDIISIINMELKSSISPIIVERPVEYYSGTKCDTTVMSKYCPPPEVPIEEGIRRML